MTVIRIGCIVEGHSETQAVPIVVQRVARREAEALVVVSDVRRIARSQLVSQQNLVAAVQRMARSQAGQGGILIVLDADDDCPASLGPRLQSWAAATRPDLPVGLVLANREFEAWFLAAAESLSGRRNLSDSIMSPPEPEAVRDAKGWLTRQMPRGKSYRAAVDQQELARHFDLDLARQRSDSFDKCYREICRLLRELTAITA